MKKQYKILAAVIVAEFAVLAVLSDLNVQVKSWIGNAIGTLFFLLPIQRLLWLLSKDEKYSTRARAGFAAAFWFHNTCYVLAAIATLAERAGLLPQ